jgi:hypothetical protein
LITRDWFDPTEIYLTMKKNGITEKSGFWFKTDRLLSQISKQISVTEAELLNIFTEKCQETDLRIKSYHCTRCIRIQYYRDVGILPISERVIHSFFELLKNVRNDMPLAAVDYEKIFKAVVNDEQWKYRVEQGSGPYLFLSYKAASKSDNPFLVNGPESWWYCIDEFIKYYRKNIRSCIVPNRLDLMKVLCEYLKPIIVHCIIPFSILPDRYYYIFYILRAFFNSIDPGETNWDAYSLDLRGTSVAPVFIVQIEELSC